MSSTAERPNTQNMTDGVRPVRPGDYLQALLITAGATLAGGLVNSLVHLDPANLVMFYLLAVVIIALRFGYGPAALSAVLSVFVFNFFFVPPQLTFVVAEAQYLLTFLGLLVAGVVIADLTARARHQAEAARRRERETAQLYSLSRELSGTVETDAILRVVVEHTQQAFGGEAGIFLPQEDRLVARALPPNGTLSPQEEAVALWVWQHGSPAGRGTSTRPEVAGRFLPLRTAQGVIGVLGVWHIRPLWPEQQRLLDAFAAQAALAIEATQLAEQARQAQLLHEKEKLQAAMLNSLSHDLRTPLVSITGTLSSLRDNDEYFDAAARRDLLDGAYQEAERLNQLVGNLLDMSRLEAGALRLKQELYDVQEIIGVARAQLRERLSGRVINIDLPPEPLMVLVDLAVFAQVVVNLLDNAIKYSPPTTPIEIRAYTQADQVVIEVADRGVGIPEDSLPRVFEKFFRAKNTYGRGGSGLGLSICQGLVEAHGGTIRAENRLGGGTCFIINLPLVLYMATQN